MTSKFEMVDGYKLRKKVRAVIANERSEFLLIQPHGYAADTWTLVGGGVEDDEDDEQAIMREIHEETGITALTGIHLSAARHWYCFSDRIKAQRQLDHDGQIAKVFFVTVAADSVVNTQTAEVQAYCWVAPDDVEILIRVPEQKELFREVVAEFAHHPIARQVTMDGWLGTSGQIHRQARLMANDLIDLRGRIEAELDNLNAVAGQQESESLIRRRQKYVSALERIDKGQYGRCCRCGWAVEPSRLAVDPTTLYCIDCVLELDSDCH